MRALDNKAATKRIKALYANKAKEELLGNEGVVEEALSIYGAVNEERNHFVVNTILKVFIKSGGHRTVHRLWSDVMSIDGVSLPLTLKCAVGPPSATASDRRLSTIMPQPSPRAYPLADASKVLQRASGARASS